MATRGVSITVTYLAWDTAANAPKTNDVANHTLRWLKDGTPAAPTNAASEVDATNAPGVYKVTTTTTEADANLGRLAGKSSTANVVIIPSAEIQFERLPDAAPGAAGGVLTAGTGTGQINPSSGKVPATLAAADVTGNVAADLQTIKTQAITCSGSVTVPAATLASTNNIASGTITTVSGNVTGSVGSIASGGITSASFGAGAINAAAIAADAIAASSLAADAVTEIATAVWANGTRTITGGTITTYTGDTPQTGDCFARLGAPAGASVSADVAAVKADTTSILDDTGTSGVVVASGSKTGYTLAAAGLDSVVIESGLNARQALSLQAAALAGILSGAATTTVTIKGAGVATTRIIATVDSDGNRSALTLTPPG